MSRGTWSLTQAPPFRYKVKGGRKAVELYDACHLHWRAGLIDSWYFGQRSPDDPTIIWEIDGSEASPQVIAECLASARFDAGVESVSWGEWWCGYRAVTITYTSGAMLTESWTPTGVVVA